MTVTCHFINSDWKLISAVLSTCHFPGSHTGERIVEKVTRFRIPLEKVVALVNVPNADIATSQVVARHDEEEEPPLPCLEME